MTPTTVPNANFVCRVRDETIKPNPFKFVTKSTKDVFNGKKTVLFSLPGAFTPTCSSTHLPRYEELYDDFKKLGVEQIICLSVNDAFVMFNWGKSIGAKNVMLLPDGNCDFTKKMNMMVDKSNLGFGNRSWRYAMVVNADMTIDKIFEEAGKCDNCASDPFEVSDADTVLAYLKGASVDKSKAKIHDFEG
eukprot:GHVH01010655.1.p1 GENE.GHVH01010655.1~~GHVH01010655.1.p1  ORF type:complete len:190 (-),score=34.11 GHVH01010655.1:21-590(-)